MEVFWPEEAADLKHVHELGSITGSYSGCHLSCACLYNVGVSKHKDPKDRSKCATGLAGNYSRRLSRPVSWRAARS
jgi:hypothetical protein